MLRRQLNLWTCLFFLSLAFASCSPFYVLEAGYHEASILLGRQKISHLLAEGDIDDRLRQQFELVLAARDFAESLGLDAKKSFTKYSAVKTDVLVWVVIAAKKTKLEPYTWWFPVVGNVPYKGFFEKEDALREAEQLRKKNYDVVVRGSAAFSTLGWFDDPLISTMMRYDDVALSDTVIHEILHNTIWVKDNVFFNETLANVVGGIGSRDFFLQREGLASKNAQIARDRLHDELLYARFLEETTNELKSFYESPDLSEAEILSKREEIFKAALEKWEKTKPSLKTQLYVDVAAKLNNAVILADQTYLSSPWVFQEFYETTGSSLPEFVKQIEEIVHDAEKRGEDPLDIVRERLKENKVQTEAASTNLPAGGGT